MASVFNIPAPGAAPAGPYVFAASDIRNPYAMTWDAYSMKLKRYLDDTYPVRQSAPARMTHVQVEAAEAPVGEIPDSVIAEKERIKAAMNNNRDSIKYPEGTSEKIKWRSGTVGALVANAMKDPTVTATFVGLDKDAPLPVGFKPAFLSFIRDEANQHAINKRVIKFGFPDI
jgi:hypothetical protein